MQTWFCNYPGSRWDPKKAHLSRTKFFGEQVVQMVRSQFHLEKTSKVGVEIGANKGKGVPITYEDLGIIVTVTAFEWFDFDEWEGDPTPKLRLKVKMERIGRRVNQAIFDTWLEIRFDNPYPKRPPHVRLMLPKYMKFQGSSHAHHMYQNGWVCFFAGWNDWNERQTMVSFLTATWNWMLWHYDTHGW